MWLNRHHPVADSSQHVGGQSFFIWGKSKMDAKGWNVWTTLSHVLLSLVPSPHYIYSLICAAQDAVDHITQWLLPVGSTGRGSKGGRRRFGYFSSTPSLLKCYLHIWQSMYFFVLCNLLLWLQLLQCLGKTFFPLALFPGQALWEQAYILCLQELWRVLWGHYLGQGGEGSRTGQRELGLQLAGPRGRCFGPLYLLDQLLD